MTATLDASRVSFSPHAVQRMLDMALEPAEVIAAMRRPPIQDSEHTQRFIGDRITVFAKQVGNGRLVVTTAVWKTRELWKRDLAIAPCGDRKVK